MIQLVLAIVFLALLNHQGPVWWHLEPYAERMQAMRQTGDWPWRYTEECANGNILPAVRGSINYTGQLFDVNVYPSAQGQLHRSTCGAAFTSRCGAGFAIACVGADAPGYPRNCDTTYNGPYLATFWWAAQHAVVKHELMHCMAVRAEDYDDVLFACRPSVSIMGCGAQHPLDYSAFDFDTWAVVHYPEPLAEYGMGQNASTYVFWGFAPETTPGDAGSPATRVAILYDDGGGAYWSGIWAPLAKAPGAYQGWHVAVAQGRCYWLKTENAVSWQRAFTEVLAGCV